MSEDRPKILIADDDPEIRMLIKSKLDTMKCEIFVAKDGEEALALALEEKPDLLLLDVMMPLLTGWEVVQNVRKKPEFDQTGIIMITGIGENVNSATAGLIGADEHIDKPFQLAELEFKVRKVIAAKRRAKKVG
jgi:two-component system, OmpR family, alkaline phosphatase synthesis response regulator PhoP